MLATGTKEAACAAPMRWSSAPSGSSSASPTSTALKAKLRTPVIFDGRNLYDPQRVRDNGLLYFAVGRGDSVSRTGA